MSPRRQKKRIALISTHGYVAADPPLGAPDTGGQVVYVLELAKKFGQFGYKVDIWTRRFENQPQIDKVDENVRVVRMPCGGKEFIRKEYMVEHIDEWVQNALKFIKSKRLNYDFISSHYWDAGVGGQKLADLLKIPHIHTPHSIGSWKKEKMETDYPDSKEEFDKKFNFERRIREEHQLYHDADLVVATTPEQLDIILRDYDLDAGSIKMIPPGYDDNRFFPVGEPTREMTRERIGFEGHVVYAVARLASNKGFDLLINGFAVTASRDPKAQLYLAIGHEDRSEGEEKIYQQLVALRKEHGLEDRIHFLGYITDDDLPDYYRAADCFVLSSRYEPFGMTAVEAMASGTPTIVTTHGGLYRILDYGVQVLFANPFDKEDLGITILKALQYGSLRRRLKEAGAHHARSFFTWTGVTQQMLNAIVGHTEQPAVKVRASEDI